jgi:hypothetical protein
MFPHYSAHSLGFEKTVHARGLRPDLQANTALEPFQKSWAKQERFQRIVSFLVMLIGWGLPKAQLG